MKDFKLGESTCLKSIAIRVKNRDLMIDFYKNIIGFDLKTEENELAIFGNVKQDSQMLILEESPRANIYPNEAKRLNRYSLVIPTIEEIATIAKRMNDADYPMKEAAARKDQVSLVLDDPEGNELEIYYTGNAIISSQATQPLELAHLIEKANETTQRLSEEVHFDKIYINARNVEEEKSFLSIIVGLDVNDDEKLHVLNNNHFHVGLSESPEGTIDLPTDEVYGLDFLKFSVTKERLLSLEEHLQMVDYDYYIDKKKSVITIYDAMGIEWWFMRK